MEIAYHTTHTQYLAGRYAQRNRYAFQQFKQVFCGLFTSLREAAEVAEQNRDIGFTRFENLLGISLSQCAEDDRRKEWTQTLLSLMEDAIESE
jgi:hypothetical protein